MERHLIPRWSSIPQPAYQAVPDSGGLYELRGVYRVKLPICGRTLNVLPGYRTDGASVPRLFWTLFGITPFDPDFLAPCAGAHDPLYSTELLSRRDADAEMAALMKINGDRAARWAKRFHLAVRMGGGSVWRKHTDRTIAAARTYCQLE